MLYHAEFYHLSTGYIEGTTPPQFSKENKKPIPACGGDSVLVLDGRNNIDNMISDATNYNNRMKNKFTGFKILKGESFTRSREITDYIELA